MKANFKGIILSWVRQVEASAPRISIWNWKSINASINASELDQLKKKRTGTLSKLKQNQLEESTKRVSYEALDYFIHKHI